VFVYVGTKRGRIIDDHDAGDDGSKRCGSGIPDEIELLDELAGEYRGQVLDPDGVEPLEEDPGAQQVGDRFAGLERYRHQNALGIGGRGVDEHVVCAGRGEAVAAPLQQRPHGGRVRHDHDLFNATPVFPTNFRVLVRMDVARGRRWRCSSKEEQALAVHDLAALWDAHCGFEFETRDVDATMATMVAEPYVSHIPHHDRWCRLRQVA
jgi:hypothetical protein